MGLGLSFGWVVPRISLPREPQERHYWKACSYSTTSLYRKRRSGSTKRRYSSQSHLTPLSIRVGTKDWSDSVRSQGRFMKVIRIYQSEYTSQKMVWARVEEHPVTRNDQQSASPIIMASRQPGSFNKRWRKKTRNCFKIGVPLSRHAKFLIFQFKWKPNRGTNVQFLRIWFILAEANLDDGTSNSTMQWPSMHHVSTPLMYRLYVIPDYTWFETAPTQGHGGTNFIAARPLYGKHRIHAVALLTIPPQTNSK
jgi:hypothetical protein